MEARNLLALEEVEDGSAEGTTPFVHLQGLFRFISPAEPTTFLMRRETKCLDQVVCGGHIRLSSRVRGAWRKMVGTVRFELTASCSQSRRANQTTLRPVKIKTTTENGSVWQSKFNVIANRLL